MSLTFVHPPRISAALFQRVLERAHSPAAAEATALYQTCTDVGIDPAVALAFYKHESTYGTAGINVTYALHNWGSVRSPYDPALAVGIVQTPDNGRFAKYATWNIALTDWCARIKHRYIEQWGLTTVDEVVPKYAPAADNNVPAAYIKAVYAAVEAWQAEEAAPMAFDWEPRRWATVAEFTAYLATIPPPAWLKALTFHHTAAPTRDQWIGLQHVKNIGAYYRDTLGWDSGPQLFLAAATGADGIYQGTPITHQGIHAGPCNTDHLGIEIVGNYSLEPWPTPVAELVYGVMVALCKWAHIPASKAQGHRECMPGHTACPGLKITPSAVRTELARRLAAGVPVNYEALWKAKHPEIAYVAEFGFPTKYRAEYDAGRPLGAVLSPEVGDPVVWQVFESGVLRLDKPSGKMRVLR